ncbi:MAG: DUF1565 domain-containing protein, partial [Kiritimatiellae bacterium]|nr:DUF1565 domain-containing protein [Kiritimatiellia bacterium]
MKRRLGVMLSFVFVLWGSTQAADYYVATTGSGADGKSWATAFTNIQTALDASTNNGDTIYLAGRTFTITNQLVWTNSGVTLQGGYEGVGEPGNNDLTRWPTVVRADPSLAYKTRIMYINGANNCCMEWLTITGGKQDYFGGGLYITNAGLTIASCQITNNTCAVMAYSKSYAGGGVLSTHSTVLMTNCVVQGNQVGPGQNYEYNYFRGGGIAIMDGAWTLVDSTIAFNRVSAYGYSTYWSHVYGGGIYSAGSLVASRCTIADNTAMKGRENNDGAGVYSTGNASINDCAISNNVCLSGTSVSRGAGICVGGGTLGLTNSIVVRNRSDSCATVYGDGVHVAGTATLRNCLVSENYALATTANCGQQVYVTTGSANILNCTLYSPFIGDVIRRDGGTVTVCDSIIWNEAGNDVIGDVGLQSCDIRSGLSNGVNGCISVDPLFERGLYLSASSPCLDVGSTTATDLGLSGLTTRADGVKDTGKVDLGYHPASGIDWTWADLFVSPAGNDTWAGTTEPTAFRTITHALSVARALTHIHIAAGTYNTAGGETFPLTMDKIGLQLLGAGNETTIVDASGSPQSVIALSGAMGDARIHGLTLTGGN